MGCLSGLAALLLLALPIAVAPQSLVGAYVLLAILTVLVFGALAWRARRAPAGEDGVRPATGFTVLGAAVVAYGVLVAVVHVVT